MRNFPRTTVLPLAALIAMTTACADGAETGTSAIDTAAPASEVTTARPEGSMTGAMMPMTARFEAVGGSGVQGDLAIAEQNGQTEVTVRLTGAAPGASHPGHIHRGTCAEIGAVVQALEPVATDASGSGSARSTAALPVAAVMDGSHVVVYHGGGGAPVTCAAISAHAM